MKTTLMKAMTTSISEVMETMFFLPIEAEGEKTLSQAGLKDLNSLNVCRLRFNGDVSGKAVLAVPDDLLIEMAENLMGESRERLTREHINGTLTEMLNMACGNSLSNVESRVPYELDIPELVDKDQLEGDPVCLIFGTFSSKMIVLLHLGR